MKQTVGTVRERERERELQFSEISFFKHAQNIIEVETTKNIDKYKIKEINIDAKRIGYYVKSITKVKMLHNSLSFL
mgnify:CR=1 FL=1